MIDRKDMLELTRRMTLTRTCFTRIAGAYMDADGNIDDTFNVNFLNLKSAEKQRHLDIAKAIPFAKTNEQLLEHRFRKENMKKGSFHQLLSLIQTCGLKNDVLMETFYEEVGKQYAASSPYGIMVYHGVYDVPMKSSAGDYQYESEEVYDFIICAIAPLLKDYETGKPDFGFLFPAFSYRSADREAIDIFNRIPEHAQEGMLQAILTFTIS